MAGVPRLIERLGALPEFRSPAAPETVWLLRDHAIQDWRDVAARADVPVLMVAGRDSQLWSCEHAAATARDNPLGSSVVIDDCGHGVNLDQPDALNEHLLGFPARPCECPASSSQVNPRVATTVAAAGQPARMVVT